MLEERTIKAVLTLKTASAETSRGRLDDSHKASLASSLPVTLPERLRTQLAAAVTFMVCFTRP